MERRIALEHPGGVSGSPMAVQHPYTVPIDIPAEYRDRVLSLQRRRNWDGEGAEPITAAACRAALRFVELVRSSQPGLALPRVAPSVHGAVSLYWRNGEEHLVLKIASGDLKRIAFHWEGPGAREEDGVEDSREAVERVLTFHRQLPLP
jgi:hypothetical protein